MIDRFLGDALGVLSCQFWSTVLPFGALLPSLLDRVVSGASFLTGGVFDCDLAHRRYVAVLRMLYKIRCYPMHPLCGPLPVPYAPVLITRWAVIAHRFTYAPPSCRTSQYHLTLFPLSVSLWNDLSDSVFDDVGLTDFKSRANTFLLA